MFKKIIISSLAAAVFIFGTAAPVHADASTESAKRQVCNGLTSQSGGDCGAGAGGNLTDVVTAALNILSVIAGIAAVIMIIVGGLKYITSGGDSSSVSGAKSTIIYAVVGLVFVAFAQFIVRFVLKSAQ